MPVFSYFIELTVFLRILRCIFEYLISRLYFQLYAYLYGDLMIAKKDDKRYR